MLSISFLEDLIKHKEMLLDDEKRNNQTEKFQFIRNIFLKKTKIISSHLNYLKTSSNSNVSSLYLLIPANSRVLKFYDNDKTVPIFYRISPISETIIILHKPAYPWYNRTTDKLVVCFERRIL